MGTSWDASLPQSQQTIGQWNACSKSSKGGERENEEQKKEDKKLELFSQN